MDDCRHTTICVLILLHMCPHTGDNALIKSWMTEEQFLVGLGITQAKLLLLLYLKAPTPTLSTTICLLILVHMCPHTTSTCVLILIYVSTYYYICVLILLYMRPHSSIYV